MLTTPPWVESAAVPPFNILITCSCVRWLARPHSSWIAGTSSAFSIALGTTCEAAVESTGASARSSLGSFSAARFWTLTTASTRSERSLATTSRTLSFCSNRTLVCVQPSVSMICARIQVAMIEKISKMLARITSVRARQNPGGCRRVATAPPATPPPPDAAGTPVAAGPPTSGDGLAPVGPALVICLQPPRREGDPASPARDEAVGAPYTAGCGLDVDVAGWSSAVASASPGRERANHSPTSANAEATSSARLSASICDSL